MYKLFLALGLALVVVAGPLAQAKSLAPSPFLTFCEKALISVGLYRPEALAPVVPFAQSVDLIRDDLIAVRPSGSRPPTLFRYTNRNLSELQRQTLYPKELVGLDAFRGKKVVDLASGEGQVVEDLQREHIDAVGVDIYLGPYQKSKPYFVQASIDHVPVLESGAYDLAMSTQGPIKYQIHDREFMLSIFREAHRLLKPGGTFIFSPIDLSDLVDSPPEGTNLDEWARTLPAHFAQYGARPEIDLAHTGLWPLPPGWRIKSAPNASWFQLNDSREELGGPGYWLEFEKL
jgi:SAM-dependent methyltransferase